MLLLPISSKLHDIFSELAQNRRIVFITGLPGVGKSLLIQQLALIAGQAGRTVHLIQWDTARKAFETPSNLAAYPEVDGVTDPMIRKSVGVWARRAIVQWEAAYPDPAHLLIGELPLIGNRLIELVEPHEDAAEPFLSRADVEYVVPVPSWEVREAIERSRAHTIANPQHENERQDASPSVLRALWQEVNVLARAMRLTNARPDSPYNPYIYGGVYEALLQHRHHRLLLVDQVLRPKQSVYDLEVAATVLQATSAEITQTIAQIEAIYTRAELQDAVANWHAIITENPKTHDAGPELRLPLPYQLLGVTEQVEFSAEQRSALNAILSLPINADADTTIAALNVGIDCFSAETPTALANVKKFDIFDSYFNVTRTDADSGHTFIHALLFSYRNILENLAAQPHSLTVVELPMLRIALETTLRLFKNEDQALFLAKS